MASGADRRHRGRLSPVARALPALLVAALACTSVASPEPTPTPTPTPTPAPTATPSPAPPVRRVTVIGDWGAGGSAQRSIARAMCRLRRARPFDIVVTTGDNFYTPDGTATARNFRRPSRCLIDGGIRWRATWGNHDVPGDSTRTVLGARNWYGWTLGGAAFFMLDSNLVYSDEQRRWLRRALGRSRARFKIAVFHHPPFTVGSVHRNDQRVRDRWVPLFRRFGVDLVLTGHNHVYERHRAGGISYVVSGGGGRGLYGCAREARSLRLCRAVHHFLVVTIGPRALTVEALDAARERIDRFSIRARAAGGDA